MQTILDSPIEEREPYNLWWFFLLEILLLSSLESFRQLLQQSPAWFIPLYISAGCYMIFQIVVPFYKKPRSDVHIVWVLTKGIGFLILMAGVFYQQQQWPAAASTLSTGIFVLLASHLFLAIFNSLRPVNFLEVAPIWLLFLAITFGLNAGLYYSMGWKRELGLLSAGFVVNIIGILVFVLLLYFNWRQYKYLLYYLPRMLYLAWTCSITLFIQPLENPIPIF